MIMKLELSEATLN